MKLLNKIKEPSTQDWLILVFLSIVWGSSFILIKESLNYFSAYQIGSLRILISSVAFLPLVYRHRKAIKWKKWFPFLLVGLFGSGFPSFLFPMAQVKLSSTVAGILNTLTPLWTLLIGVILFGTLVKGKKILGVVIGLSGAVLLIVLGEKISLDENIKYGIFIILATVCYGASVNIVASKFKNTKSIIVSSLSFALLLPFAISAFFIAETQIAIQTTPDIWKGLLFVSILSLLGTFFSSILFYKMVQRTNALFGSSVTYTIPIVSTMWGVWDGENIGLYHIIGAVMIIVGVFLSRKS